MTQDQPYYELRPFSRVHASLVAGWVHHDDELFRLAPQTRPPMTPEKAIAWTKRRGRPLLLWASTWPEPVGYAELNDMPSRPGELWIGHFIIAPHHRGRKLGRELLALLLGQAFGSLRASRVALIVFPNNAPAIRCYESGGLVHESWQTRTFVSRPGTHKMMEMAIDRAAYLARTGQSDPSM